MKKNITIVLLAAILNTVCFSQQTDSDVNKGVAQPKVELLWPKGAPDAKGDTEADKPTLTIFLPPKDKSCGSAVVICPGGAYQFCAMEHEGYQIAKWLNSLGVAGFVLKYRHKGDGYSHPAPLQDAQRAIRTVRSRAAEFNINPDKIGIIGFSAGGHLASTAGTHFDKGDSSAKDPNDRLSSRPDFMILIYAVITMTEPYTHLGSRKNLLGENPTQEMIDYMSNEKQVTSETPPAFLVHASDDSAVPVENSVNFYLALQKAGIPAEMHIYEKGQHGFGLGSGPVSSWTVHCADWMRLHNFLSTNN